MDENESESREEGFLSSREINKEEVTQALRDVLRSPGMRPVRLELEVERLFDDDGWSGNIHRWSF